MMGMFIVKPDYGSMTKYTNGGTAGYTDADTVIYTYSGNGYLVAINTVDAASNSNGSAIVTVEVDGSSISADSSVTLTVNSSDIVKHRSMSYNILPFSSSVTIKMRASAAGYVGSGSACANILTRSIKDYLYSDEPLDKMLKIMKKVKPPWDLGQEFDPETKTYKTKIGFKHKTKVTKALKASKIKWYK